MNIGQFKQNARGNYYGFIATAKMDLGRLALRPVQSNNDRAPLYAIDALNPGNRAVQIGSLWEATSNSTGEVFLQGSVDDPSLPGRLPIALFSDGKGGFRVAWRRDRRRAETAAPKPDAPERSGSGDLDDEEVPY